MDVIELKLDGALYSADVVTRALHRQTADAYVELASIGAGYQVRLAPRATFPAAVLQARFMTDLVDERLRERVAARTDALRDVLISAALREAGGAAR